MFPTHNEAKYKVTEKSEVIGDLNKNDFGWFDMEWPCIVNMIIQQKAVYWPN